jgi:hypothetical protein
MYEVLPARTPDRAVNELPIGILGSATPFQCLERSRTRSPCFVPNRAITAAAGVCPAARGTVPSLISVKRLSRLGEEKSVNVPFFATTLKAPVFGFLTRPNTELTPLSGVPQATESVPAGRAIFTAVDAAYIRTIGRLALFMNTAGA